MRGLDSGRLEDTNDLFLYNKDFKHCCEWSSFVVTKVCGYTVPGDIRETRSMSFNLTHLGIKCLPKHLHYSIPG